MNKNILIAGAGIALAGGLVYYARTAKQPPAQQTQGLVRQGTPVLETICIEPIQNLSRQPINMDGVDDELVAQLQRAEFQSHKLADAGPRCDGTVDAEVVDISGRGRKTARVDYRLTLANEQVPRISSSAEGKSGGEDSPSAKPVAMSFVGPSKKDKSGPEREAIVAALRQQADQIRDAKRRGLPPWLPPQ